MTRTGEREGEWETQKEGRRAKAEVIDTVGEGEGQGEEGGDWRTE